MNFISPRKLTVWCTFVACFALGHGLAQTKVDGMRIIKYEPEKPLSWDDFRKRALPGQQFHALSYCGIYFEADRDNDTIRFNVFAYFVPSKSWSKKKGEAKSLLEHEQRHFDMTEIYARKLRAALVPYELPIADFFDSNAPAQTQKLFQTYYAAYNAAQDAYDKESRHGLEKIAQEKWTTQILEDLQSLASHSYAQPVYDRDK